MQTELPSYSKSSTIMIAHNLEVVSYQHEHTLYNFSSAILKYHDKRIVTGHDVKKYKTIQFNNIHTDSNLKG